MIFDKNNKVIGYRQSSTTRTIDEYYDKTTDEYSRAMVLKQNYINQLEKQKIDDPEFYIAIVFPELMRYTEIRDKLETL